MSQVQFQIAKFKFRQYQNTTFFAISPNEMPAKFSRYTVYNDEHCMDARLSPFSLYGMGLPKNSNERILQTECHTSGTLHNGY